MDCQYPAFFIASGRPIHLTETSEANSQHLTTMSWIIGDNREILLLTAATCIYGSPDVLQLYVHCLTSSWDHLGNSILGGIKNCSGNFRHIHASGGQDLRHFPRQFHNRICWSSCLIVSCLTKEVTLFQAGRQECTRTIEFPISIFLPHPSLASTCLALTSNTTHKPVRYSRITRDYSASILIFRLDTICKRLALCQIGKSHCVKVK